MFGGFRHLPLKSTFRFICRVNLSERVCPAELPKSPTVIGRWLGSSTLHLRTSHPHLSPHGRWGRSHKASAAGTISAVHGASRARGAPAVRTGSRLRLPLPSPSSAPGRSPIILRGDHNGVGVATLSVLRESGARRQPFLHGLLLRLLLRRRRLLLPSGCLVRLLRVMLNLFRVPRLVARCQRLSGHGVCLRVALHRAEVGMPAEFWDARLLLFEHKCNSDGHEDEHCQNRHHPAGVVFGHSSAQIGVLPAGSGSLSSGSRSGGGAGSRVGTGSWDGG